MMPDLIGTDTMPATHLPRNKQVINRGHGRSFRSPIQRAYTGLRTLDFPIVSPLRMWAQIKYLNDLCGAHVIFGVTAIPWNNGMVEDWNNDSRTKRTFQTRKKMQSNIGVMPEDENANVGFALVSIIPIFQHSNIPHPYGMLLLRLYPCNLHEGRQSGYKPIWIIFRRPAVVARIKADISTFGLYFPHQSRFTPLSGSQQKNNLSIPHCFVTMSHGGSSLAHTVQPGRFCVQRSP